jgi:DEAD/DEAH box helicase domain-containing protein
VFSNPDMVHAALLPEHPRWARFLSGLRYLVLDELHTYSGIFGANMAHLLTRLFRVCEHYGSRPQLIACSATIANAPELARRLSGRDFVAVDRDGSPRGRRVYVFWNPPRIRQTAWRSRRSANVEAHELMARLIARGVPTIAFSKARMTAEMIHRYVTERLRELAPGQTAKVMPYRGGYLPEDRREIERRLFAGELIGVSATRALELGIDVGALEACVIVGYPGTLASFFQQSGRAGRREADSVVFLIGLDTSINQYVMGAPEYIFERCVEHAVVDPDNPFVTAGHVRCAAHEKPLADAETPAFGPYAEMALEVLEGNRKVRHIGGHWYHAAPEVPQHEVSLRCLTPANVVIQDAATGAALGEVDRYDAPPLVHPGAVYLQRGETYVVVDLDLELNVARVQRTETDYYTQPLGGVDVHHIDHRLREKPFGSGTACWGEVTAHMNTYAFEKVRFYELDAISVHGLNLPTMVLETMAVWLVPPEALMEQTRRAGLDAHSGLRGLGYATRMLLPLFITCDTLDFSHSVGSVNSPWNAVFIFERYPHGLGYTARAYELLDRILPAVLRAVEACPCEEGCPCCVGKPLRQESIGNVERGEGSIPSKAAALFILRGLLGDGAALRQPDCAALAGVDAAETLRLSQSLRRRLERMGEPEVFHPIVPAPEVKTGYPEPEREVDLPRADADKRAARKRDFDRDLHRKIAKKVALGGLPALQGKPAPPPGMKTEHSNLRPIDFPGRPRVRTTAKEMTADGKAEEDAAKPQPPIIGGDPIAAMARKKKRAMR